MKEGTPEVNLWITLPNHSWNYTREVFTYLINPKIPKICFWHEAG